MPNNKADEICIPSQIFSAVNDSSKIIINTPVIGRSSMVNPRLTNFEIPHVGQFQPHPVGTLNNNAKWDDFWGTKVGGDMDAMPVNFKFAEREIIYDGNKVGENGLEVIFLALAKTTIR